MEDIIIKHPRDKNRSLKSMEESLYLTKGEDCGFTKDTVQSLLDKIKEQDSEIKKLRKALLCEMTSSPSVDFTSDPID